ncbi:hypothetical protein ES703_104934 [subsurface metagenome]
MVNLGAYTPSEHWEQVDDVTPDEDASYVSENYSQTTIDLYNLESLPAGVGVISNVAVWARVRRTAAATCSVSVKIKTGGTIYSSGVTYLTGTSWGYKAQSWATNPQTGNPWTVADVNALQAGIGLAGNNYLGNQVRCTQVYVVVTYTVVAPTVTTDPATSVESAAATPNGTLDDGGGEACDCGFEWGPDVGKGITTPTESKIKDDTFSQIIGGLVPNTTYHFRAFATNSSGTGYGADRTFTTSLIISRAYALAREEL